MNESTPTNKTPKFRHAPTPKISERKKKLFEDSDSNSNFDKFVTVVEEEDSDLGPMSELQFSSSPTNFNKIMGGRATDYVIEKDECLRTSFKNILGTNNSPISTPDRTSLKDSNLSEIANEEAIDPGKTLDDSVILEKENYAKQMKTPNELVSMPNTSEQLLRGLSFRKSLIFDTGLTPHDDVSPSGKSNDSSISNEHPKAKTSLSFSEPLISAKSFYGAKNTIPEVKKKEEFNRSINYHVHSVPKLSRSRITPIARKMASRKAAYTKGPSLWRHGGAIKKIRNKLIKPLKKKSKEHWLRTATVVLDKGATLENKDVEKPKPIDSAGEIQARKEHIERLQKIFKEQTGYTTISNPANCTSGEPSVKVVPEKVIIDTFDNSDDDDDDDDEPLNKSVDSIETQVENKENDVAPSNRKFFKSTQSNTTKKYRIMSGFSATLKRGCDMKLERTPKRIKKARRGKTVILNTEITSIIDRLSSPQKRREPEPEIITEQVLSPAVPMDDGLPNGDVNVESTAPDLPTNMDDLTDEYAEKYRKMIPYETSDPEKVSQQESILELLISNGICNDETFKIFISEPDLHKAEASKILDNMYCLNTTLEPDNAENATDKFQSSVVEGADKPFVDATETVDSMNDVPMSPASQISNMTLSLALDCTSETNKDQDQTSSQYFPIFNKDSARPKANRNLFEAVSNTGKKWKTIGDRQYQIDAGQKEFGMKMCPQCEMYYSVHEPEDEMLHLKYHNAINVLAFKGWTSERVVTDVPEWGLRGRIIVVCESDSKSKKSRIKDILAIVDRDLGFSSRTFAPKTLVYLGIAKNQVIGVCVAQPLAQANRLVTEGGLDCCTTQSFPVRCGISRIWVAPPYRRFGVASSLVAALRGHFIVGSFLDFNEIAFSSPTESGKKLAARLTERNDFMVYER